MKIFLRRVGISKKPEIVIIRQILLKKIDEHFQILLSSEFGNYLIQELFLHFSQEEMKGFHTFIAKNFFKVSCTKYSSIIAAKMVSHFWKKNEQFFEIVAQ